MTDDPLVRYEVDRAVATLTLDSPRNRNALSSTLVAQLEQGLADAAKDPSVRAVVLTHTGGTFCAGADLSEATTGDPTANPRRLVAVMRAVIELPKPVIAQVDGHVRAGGLGLLGACDLALAGPSSTFAFTEVRLGLAPAAISLALLPRLDPRGAARWYLTGSVFDPAEAQQIGLLTQAPPDTAEALAPLLDALRLASPQGLAETKRLVTAEVLRTFERDGESMVAQSALLFGSDEAREGMLAFLERRPPRWAS
ncbi:enoyl-CoA hydratase family protein [Streptacidiphilus sp. N1-12]|uniref:Enoyl-CoA hydratase family protein n=2 Tax=Streptacidiphilus alkalitolerans TaxID=3342712 RepID=A0ABV6WWU6_9ACTN